jgi:prophage regulatory protein
MNAQPDRLIRLEEVKDIVGLGKTMIYRLERDGRFPRRCKPGGHATRWSEAEVVAWKEAQLAERRAA